MDLKQVSDKLGTTKDVLELEELILFNREMFEESNVILDGTVEITSVGVLGLVKEESKYTHLRVELAMDDTTLEVELELIDPINATILEEGQIVGAITEHYLKNIEESKSVDVGGIVFSYGEDLESGVITNEHYNNLIEDSNKGVDDIKDNTEPEIDDSILGATYPGSEYNADKDEDEDEGEDEEIPESELEESDLFDNTEDTTEDTTEDKPKENKGDFSDVSLEGTGIELYHNGVLYNTEENLTNIQEGKGDITEENDDEPKIVQTKTTNLSVIDYKNVLEHINREEIKRDYFRYYTEISYTPGEIKEGFVDKVTAWVSFKAIKENGKEDMDGVSVVDIPLGEDDKMAFGDKEEADVYFNIIAKEDSENVSEGIQEANGNRYVYFKSKESGELYSQELENWEEHFNKLKSEGKVLEYMESKGFKVTPKKVKKEEITKPPVESDINTSEDVKEKTEESNEHRQDSKGYFKMEVEEVITGLRTKDVAIRGVNVYVDNKIEELRQKGVSDICLKEVEFEYEWGHIEGLNDVSESILFYLHYDNVTAHGIENFKMPMRVRLTTLVKEGKPYITKEDFGELIIKTDNLISEIDKKGYTKFLYKGITIYIGKKGQTQYKTYIKEQGIEEDLQDKPSQAPVSSNEEVGERTDNKEDMLTLIRNLHTEVHQKVAPDKLRKSNEMLKGFLKDRSNDKKIPLRVQYLELEGVCLVIDDGGEAGILEFDYAMGLGDLGNMSSNSGRNNNKRGRRNKHSTRSSDSKQNPKKGEVLIIHPFFIIAANDKGVSRVVYKKLTSNMSLSDLENMLVNNGYATLSGISRILNLRNYKQYKTTHNRLMNDVTRSASRTVGRAVGRASVNAMKSGGRALIGSNKKNKGRK